MPLVCIAFLKQVKHEGDLLYTRRLVLKTNSLPSWGKHFFSDAKVTVILLVNADVDDQGGCDRRMLGGQEQTFPHLVHQVNHFSLRLIIFNTFLHSFLLQEHWSHPLHGHRGEGDDHPHGEQQLAHQACEGVLDRLEYLWVQVCHQEVWGGQVQEELRPGH